MLPAAVRAGFQRREDCHNSGAQTQDEKATPAGDQATYAAIRVTGPCSPSEQVVACRCRLLGLSEEWSVMLSLVHLQSPCSLLPEVCG